METTGSNYSGSSSKDQVRSALDEGQIQSHGKTDRLSDQGKPAMDKFTQRAHGVVDRMSDVASKMTSGWSDRSAKMKDMQSQVLADTRQRIREKPVAALAIAAAAGFLLRQLMRGRSRH